MADEVKDKTVETGKQVEDSTPDYLEALQTLKQNSVDRSKYEELKAENKKLIDAVVNGQSEDVQSSPKYRDVSEIREDLFNHEHSNLEYVKLALELRETLISKGEPDPFLPIGSQIAPTADDEAKAEKVAEIYKECIDYAQGDSKLFTQELMRRTNTSIYDKIQKKKEN